MQQKAPEHAGTLPSSPQIPPAVQENPRPSTPAHSPSPSTPRVVSTTLNGITFEGVAFDSRTHRLVVIDQARGPGSLHADAASAARSVNGFAAINAGFFTPEGDPIGLVISSKKRAGSWNRSSFLGSGVWCEDASGKSMILRREALGPDRAAQMRELLQSGPMLVDQAKSVSGLDATKSSIRTVLLWDGGHRWWMGRSSPCTLATVSHTLSTTSPAGWKIYSALNLDGGRSSEIWISGNLPGGPLTRRPPWNRPVRNFLVLQSH